MPSTRNGNICASQPRNTKGYAPLSQRDFNAFIGTTSEKDDLRVKMQSLRSGGSSVDRTKVFLLASATCLLALIWALKNGCIPLRHGTKKPAATFNVAKEIARSPSIEPSTAVLEVFQVYRPVLASSGKADETLLHNTLEDGEPIGMTASAKGCQVLLMEHSFGFSYGKPFVGSYAPPKCKFNRVTMNFTVTSRGRQFDRLAIMYFNDTEVWRTSTAEPTVNGIRWEYTKDMSPYMYFWNSPQKIIFDLGNLIDDTYTGPFNTTLTATFSNIQDEVEPASLILPISARNGAHSAASVFMLPGDNATNTISFPRNVKRAVFSVSACGQAAEEFWWSNVLQSDIHTFEAEAGTLYGYSPFREIQILIDGQLAGVQWPFPVIFTGGIVPGLWRPIVGIDAFDLREHEIDITPWLSILCDGNEHSFEIRVVGIADDGKSSGTLTETVGSSWYVTGKIFVWLDSNGTAVTIGRAPTILLPEPVINLSQTIAQNKTGANETLEYTTDVKRTLSISSLLTTQSGTQLVTWTQNLAVTNYGFFTGFGALQLSKQTTTGTDQSTGGTYYKSSYSYPLSANTSFIIQQSSGNFSIDATILLGLNLQTQGTPVHTTFLQCCNHEPNSFSGTSVSTNQNGSAHYFASPKAGLSTGFGSTGQEFSFEGNTGTRNKETYYRNVEAVNGTVVRDYESLDGVKVMEFEGTGLNVTVGCAPMMVSPRQVLGRGPGKAGRNFVKTRQFIEDFF